MPASPWTGRQGWILLGCVGGACVAALLIVGLFPAPTTSSCNGCGGTELGTVLGLGTPVSTGTASNHLYCFPVAWTKATVYLYLVDIGFQTPAGVWLTPDLNWTVTYSMASGPTLAVYVFGLGNDTDNSGWLSGGTLAISAGGQFCIGTGAISLTGQTFVLGANAFSPTGYVTAKFP